MERTNNIAARVRRDTHFILAEIELRMAELVERRNREAGVGEIPTLRAEIEREADAYPALMTLIRGEVEVVTAEKAAHAKTIAALLERCELLEALKDLEEFGRLKDGLHDYLP